jgi:uncharacterized protein (TIGR00661 family)
MARIIYGVAGEGYGHSTRSHVIVQRLLECGHDVMVVGSNKSLTYLREYFGERVQEIFGLRFEIVDGRVAPFGTVMKNARQLGNMLWINRELYHKHFTRHRPELIISDFEPFCAWWAWRHNIPYVSLDNEHLLTHCKLAHDPKNLWARLKAEAVTRCYYVGARAYVVLSFFDAPVKKKNVMVVPPVIRQPVMEMKPTEGDHIVVYSTAGHNSEDVARLLNSFGGQEFHVYGYGRTDTIDRCVFRPISTEGFLADVASSKGVVASAGFSLLSECMHFRKKILVMPLEGQYEQMINADYVETLGLGVKSWQLDEHSLVRLIMETEKPVSNDRRILWPDNEKFFVMLEGLFQKLGMNIRTTK